MGLGRDAGWAFSLALLAAGCTRAWPEMEDCRATSTVRRVAGRSYDPVDVLFVIDRGPSMAQEQALLARELPRMIELFLEGGGRGNAVRSVRTGVVSSDLGAPLDGCSELGDAGVLRRSAECGSEGRASVWHFEGFHDSARALDEIACNARLGAEGCAIAQPLEAMLEALASDDSAFHSRVAPTSRPPYLLIVIITDKDDCSLAAPVEGAAQLGLDCSGNPSLHPVQRYVRALEERTNGAFGVLIIAGLPADLERSDERGFGIGEAQAQEAYYAQVLNDPRLALRAAGDACQSPSAAARPPRRLIEFARALGERGGVQSICSDDFRRGLQRLFGVSISSQLGVVDACVPTEEFAEARTECRLIWELPPHDPEQPLTPVQCSDQPELLRTPSTGFPPRSERGRPLCEVRQIERSDAAGGAQGFYLEPSPSCGPGERRVAFTDAAQPPIGVRATVSCTHSACAPEP